MKYTLKNLKYLVFTLTFVIVGFAFSNSTHASTYSYSCSDGGTITSTVDISPTGPFSAGNTTPFHVSASMQSFSCGTREVNLTAQNNSGVTHTIIPNQTLNQNGFIPPVIDSVNFAAPSTAGTYAVHFITGVDEPVGIYQSYSNFTNLGAIIGICRVYGANNQGELETGYFIATRDVDTEQNAAARGVTRVEVDYNITTDNQDPPGGNYQTTHMIATFYPGELEVEVPVVGGHLNHDAGGFCSAIVNGDGYGGTYIQEYF
jgi:hypothetical protein